MNPSRIENEERLKNEEELTNEDFVNIKRRIEKYLMKKEDKLKRDDNFEIFIEEFQENWRTR